MTRDDLTMEQKTLLWGGPRLAAVGSADWMACRDLQAKGLMIQGTRFAAGEAASDMFHLTRKGMERHAELRAAGGGIRPAPSLQVDVVPANPFPPVETKAGVPYEEFWAAVRGPVHPNLDDSGDWSSVFGVKCPQCGEKSDGHWYYVPGDGPEDFPKLIRCVRGGHVQDPPLDSAPKPAPASRWVPVEERLPRIGQPVDVLRDWKPAGRGRLTWKDKEPGETWWATCWKTDEERFGRVTHWLEEVVPPLPERPKEAVAEPPGKWVRWGIGECRNRARTEERYVAVSTAGGKVADVDLIVGCSGFEGFFRVRDGHKAAFPQPAWIIREEDFLALCPGPWSDGKGEA